MLHKTAHILLCLLMLLSLAAAFPVSAENESNVSFIVSATEVAVGDTVTVTFSHRDMSIVSFGGGIRFDKTLLTCETITGRRDGQESPDCYMYEATNDKWVSAAAFSNLEDAAKAGTVGFAFALTREAHYTEGILFVATFRAKANGTAVFTSYESTDGPDGYDSNASDSVSVKIGTGIASTPTETADPADASDPTKPSDPSHTAAPAPQETASPSDKTGNSPLKTVLRIGIPTLVAVGAVAVLLVLKRKK